MTADRRITFYYAPNTRALGTLILLEELGADYELHLLNTKKGEQRAPAYLAINPMGKVPAIKHGDAVITEQPAVFMYLADLYPEAKLAPPIGDPLRGPFLRWMVFYGSCFEPALSDKAQNNPPVPPSRCAYGDFDTMWKTLTNQLARGPYLLGEQFTAADVLWGTALRWSTMFKLVPETPEVKAYIERTQNRAAVTCAHAKEAEFATQVSA
jgi:glutathione S-transferase